MSALLKPLQWFYHEFGLGAINETGRNAYIIITARCLRMIANGAVSLILALFLSALEFPDYRIGAFMSATLLGDIFLGTFLTLIADRVGRRKVLIGGSLLMITSGLAFAYIENYWILLISSVLGVVSATGGDFGPFRSIEESIISHLTTPRTRADVLAWYITCSTFGAALGSEIGGRIIHALQDKGWELVDAYHSIFLLYTMTGTANVILALLLTSDCEITKTETYSRIPQEEDEGEMEETEDHHNSAIVPDSKTKEAWYNRIAKGITSRLSQISTTTLKIMYKLWFLLFVDSLADGLVPYALTNYYIEQKFQPTKATLGDINGVAYLLGAVSTTFAGPLARKIGLVNTMVFTHVPSSAAVLLFPLPSNFALTVVLLFVRAGLNNLDQAPRSAFIAAVVKPDERTAALGITTVIRTLAAMLGPTVTGVLADGRRFWIAFVVAGSCRLVYDFGLYALFVNLKLYQNEPSTDGPGDVQRFGDEEDLTELDDLTGSIASETMDKTDSPGSSTESAKSPNLMPLQESQLRRRSPSPIPKTSS